MKHSHLQSSTHCALKRKQRPLNRQLFRAARGHERFVELFLATLIQCAGQGKSRGGIDWHGRQRPVALSGQQGIQFVQGLIGNPLVVGDGWCKIIVRARYRRGLNAGPWGRSNLRWLPPDGDGYADHHQYRDGRQRHAPVRQGSMKIRRQDFPKGIRFCRPQFTGQFSVKTFGRLNIRI